MSKLLRDHISFFSLLSKTSRAQRISLLQSITNEQLQSLLEVIFNVVNNAAAIPNKLYLQKLIKYKGILRQLVDKNISRKRKLNILIKHNIILPVLLDKLILFICKNG